jgi:hypothetical protein
MLEVVFFHFRGGYTHFFLRMGACTCTFPSLRMCVGSCTCIPCEGKVHVCIPFSQWGPHKSFFEKKAKKKMIKMKRSDI